MEVRPTQQQVQPLFYRPKGWKYCEISFDGMKFYTFKIKNVKPYSWTKKMDYIILYTDNNMIKCDGYYNRPERIIVFFENRKVYNLYRGIIQRQKMERTNQRFLLTGDEIRKKEKMSVKGWMEEFGGTFLNAENVKRGDVFCIKSIDLVENDQWDKPRITATLSPVESALEGEEYFAGLGKQNLERLTEGFETDDEKAWLGKNIEVAAIMTYHIGGQKQKGIVWEVVGTE